MARYPDRNALGSNAPRYAGGTVDYGGLGAAQARIGSAAAGIGDALAATGTAIAALDTARTEKRQQDERFIWTTQRMVFEDQQDQAYREAAETADPGADGFATRIIEAYDRAAREMVGNAPEHLVPSLDQRLYAKRAALLDAATRFEEEEKDRFFGNQLEDGETSLIKRAMDNPEMLKELETEGLDLIDQATHLTPIERDAAKRKFRQTIQERTLLTNAAAPNRARGLAVSAGAYESGGAAPVPADGLAVTPYVSLSDRAAAPEYQGVAPSLRHIMEEAARRTGVRIQVRSGKEHRDGGGRHPAGDALDVWLVDRDGNRIAHGAGGTSDRPELASSKRDAARNFALYEQFAREARHIQRELYPALDNSFRWGGYFGGDPSTYGAMDTMHFDLGGSAMAGGSWSKGLNPSQVRAWEAAGYSFEYGHLDDIRVDPRGGGDHWRGDASAPRGIRNNNPGNIRDGQFAQRVVGYRGPDGGFAQFETPEQGLYAMARLLTGYERDNGLRTVSGIIGKWAPPSENDTSSYATSIAAELGIDPDAAFSFARDRSVGVRLMQAMIARENGQMPYSPDQIAAAYDAAVVGAPPPAGTAAELDGGGEILAGIGPEYDAVSPQVYLQAQQIRAKEIAKLEKAQTEASLGDLAASIGRSDDYETVVDKLKRSGRLTAEQATRVRDEAAVVNTAGRIADGDVFNTEDSSERKKLDNVFDRVAQEAGIFAMQPDTLAAVEAFVGRTNYIPKRVRDVFGTMLKTTDPEMLQKAIELGALLENAAPLVFESPSAAGGVVERQRRQYGLVKSLVGYFGPEAAIARLQAPVSKTLDKEVDKELKDWTVDEALAQFDESVWTDPVIATRQRDAFDSLYREIYTEFRARGADGDIAHEKAVETLGRRWGVTNIGGKQQFMEYPPERVFGVPTEFIAPQFAADMREKEESAEDAYLVTTPETLKAINLGSPQVPWMVVEQKPGEPIRTIGYWTFDRGAATEAARKKLTSDRETLRNVDAPSSSEIGASLFGSVPTPPLAETEPEPEAPAPAPLPPSPGAATLRRRSRR